MSLNLLMFGKTGQVARAVLDHAKARPDLVVTALDHDVADLDDSEACVRAVGSLRPDAILITAAFTRVDEAETHHARAFQINAHTPGAIAEAAALSQVPLVYLSSDYVFDGTLDRPYRESDAPNPLNIYGASKRAGELAVLAANSRSAVLRTSWIFAPRGENFIKTVIRLARTGKPLRIVDDQVGGPTPAGAVAASSIALAAALARDAVPAGIYHFQGRPSASWADLADAVLHELAVRGERVPALERIATRDFPTPARRPLRTVLDCGRIESALNLSPPDWRAQVGAAVTSYQGA